MRTPGSAVVASPPSPRAAMLVPRPPGRQSRGIRAPAIRSNNKTGARDPALSQRSCRQMPVGQALGADGTGRELAWVIPRRVSGHPAC